MHTTKTSIWFYGQSLLGIFLVLFVRRMSLGTIKILAKKKVLIVHFAKFFLGLFLLDVVKVWYIEQFSIRTNKFSRFLPNKCLPKVQIYSQKKSNSNAEIHKIPYFQYNSMIHISTYEWVQKK